MNYMSLLTTHVRGTKRVRSTYFQQPASETLKILLATLVPLGVVAVAALIFADGMAPTQPAPDSTFRSTEYRRVSNVDLGLSFEVPADWVQPRPGESFEDPSDQRFGAEVLYDKVPRTDRDVRFGNHVPVLSREPITHSLGSGTRWRLAMADPAVRDGTPPSYTAYVLLMPRRGGTLELSAFGVSNPGDRMVVDARLDHLLQSLHVE